MIDTHDGRRSWTRCADGVNDLTIAKLMATFLLTPRGAALVYYGQELGMQNRDPRTVEEVQEITGKRGWPNNKGRDGERTPMQWTAGPNAGFSNTTGRTWYPVADRYEDRNAAAEAKDPNSLLSYYKVLIRLRKQNASLRDGDFQSVEAGDDIVAWVTKSAGEAAVVALNFSAKPQTISISAAKYGLKGVQATTLIGNTAAAGARVTIDKLTLPPYGAFVGTLK